MDIIFKELCKIVESTLLTSPGCHDYNHTLRVYHNAMTIFAMEKKFHKHISKDVVRFGAMLHDISRPEELAAEGKICHAELGSEKGGKILRSFDCDDSFISSVCDAIRTHRFRSGNTPKTIEAKIIYDADKLDSIGAIGIGRAFHFAGRVGAKVHNRADEALNSPSYSLDDTAYREYLVKLKKIPSKLLTKSGQELAKERSGFMDLFFDRLNNEVFGE